MRHKGIKRKIERFACDKRSFNRFIIQINKSFCEVNNIINGGNNKKK